MTVGAAWIRAGSESNELWFASDSRLSGDGFIWDDCPKLMPLPRRDAVVAFSGSTEQGYPLLLQIASAIAAYRAALDGHLEFFKMAGHLERVMNSMMNRLRIDPAVHGIAPNHREFATRADAVVLGGYARQWGRMALRALEYNGGARAWIFRPIRPQFGEGRSFGRSGIARRGGAFCIT
jgi:hypothetical protein